MFLSYDLLLFRQFSVEIFHISEIIANQSYFVQLRWDYFISNLKNLDISYTLSTEKVLLQKFIPYVVDHNEWSSTILVSDIWNKIEM